MSLETWAAFVAASTILLVIPGPTILLVVSYALGQGWRAALPTAIGVALGDLTAMTVSVVGLGALLAASATLFTAVKWLGAAYLVWLGVKLWRAGGRLDVEAREGRGSAGAALAMIGHAWIVTALNPKSIVFFVAFLPQFVDGAAPFSPQLAIFEATFVALAFANALGYAAVATRARRFVRDPRAVTAVNRVGGSLLIGAAVSAVTLRTARA